MEIITCLVSILGALLSGIFAYVGSRSAAKLSSDAQIKTAAQTAFITARISAFSAFEEAFEAWCNTKSKESFAALYRAENSLRLVASRETSFAVSELTQHVRMIETGHAESITYDEIATAHINAIDAMRRDIRTYPVPRPESTYPCDYNE